MSDISSQSSAEKDGNDKLVITSDGSAHLSPEDIQKSLTDEAEYFMKNLMPGKETGDRAAKRGESFFDAVSRKHLSGEGGDKNVSFVRLSKVLPVTVEWKNLNYVVPVGKGKNKTSKTILENVSGQVPPGRLCCIVGSTGAGKTSLLNAIAGRLQVGGSLTGEILVNGQPRGRAFNALSAYVLQDDVLFSNLTVRETFEFAARMRLPKDVSKETKDALVTQIITELGLIKAQNTRIGNEFIRGVSGGERKRTNIGIELISGASLVLLDEPSSGLDSFNALNVVEALWTLAGGGRTIICTIHQPRSSIYSMMDLLIVLSEGRTMYFGPAKEAVSWFASAGFKCPREFNPADFFLDVVSMDYRTVEEENASRRRIQLLGDKFANDAATVARRQSVDVVQVQEMAEANKHVTFPNNRFVEFWLLLNRSWKQSSRDRLPQMITIVQTIVIGFVLAALYSNMSNSQTQVQDETGILFFVCIFAAFGAMFGALNSFPSERKVVNRERASKMYHVLPYYIARFISETPLRVGTAILFGAIVYWIVGLNPTASAFFIFVAILFVEGLAAQGLGVAVSAGARNEKVALALAPAITVILILFGGFYVNQATIPVWLRWVKYLSHLYWAFMALSINDFGGRTGFRCPEGSAPGCTLSGDDILVNYLHFNPSQLWLGFVGLIALIIGYNGLGYILLRRSKPKYLPLDSAASAKKAKK